jgi:hypothetical protein
MASKSFFAFRYSMEQLIETMNGTPLYFWTFTFREVLDIDEACKRWSKFLGGATQKGSLVNCFPLMSGIRVFEMHPGGRDGHSHGLHIHAVVDKYLPVDVVRRIWHSKAGEDSRLQVSKIGPGKAYYIGKYLAKGKREPALDGKQLWACFGMADNYRCQDIIVESKWTEAYKFLGACVAGFHEANWNVRLRMTTEFVGGQTVESTLQRFGYKMLTHDSKWEEDDDENF